MTAPGQDNRRGSFRARVAYPVRVESEGTFSSDNGKPATNALLLDLTPAGAGFVYPGELEPGQTVEIGFNFPNGPAVGSEKATALQAKLIWHDPRTNRYGAAFSERSFGKEQLKEALRPVTKAFVYERTVYLPDTNAEGNMYFARFFDWQGEAREAYLKQGITPEEYRAMVVSRTLLVTAKATMEYLRMLTLFDPVYVRFTTRNIRGASLEMHFSFFHGLTAEPVGRGNQLLTFRNKRGRIIPIPEPIRRIAQAIEEAPSKEGSPAMLSAPKC